MGLYLGSNKIKINAENVGYYMHLFSQTPITNGVRLLTSNGYILKDSDGLYLTTKEEK